MGSRSFLGKSPAPRNWMKQVSLMNGKSVQKKTAEAKQCTCGSKRDKIINLWHVIYLKDSEDVETNHNHKCRLKVYHTKKQP